MKSRLGSVWSASVRSLLTSIESSNHLDRSSKACILRTGLAPKSLFRIAISLVVTNCMTPNTVASILKSHTSRTARLGDLNSLQRLRSTKFFLGKGPALIPFFHNWCSLMAGDGTRKLLIIMGSILRPKTARPNPARLLEVNIDTLRGLPRGPHQNRLDPNALHQTARAKFRRSRNVVVADKSQFCALSISRLLRTRRVSSPRAARRHFCGGGWRPLQQKMRLTYQSINGMLGDETWKNAARGCEGLKKGDGRQEAAKRQHRAGAATCYRGIYSVSTQLLIHKFPCLSTSKVAIFAHAGLPATTVIQLGLDDSAVPSPLNLPTRDVQQEQNSPRPPGTKRGNRLKRHYTLNFIKESPWSVYEKHVDVSYKTPRHSCIVAQKRSKGNARVHIKKIVEHSKEATANRLLLLQSAPILFVPILEVYEQPSSMYLVYELVEHTLQDLVRSQHSLEIKELGAIVKQMLEGLIYLEVNGVGLLDLECADIRFRPNGCLQIVASRWISSVEYIFTAADTLIHGAVADIR
ncbi:uncharacterized protein PpBr36_11128 [Pyricularia pennisetigena]|uniref:uncharacterized protein n=1 Tax=Pyricularia pennisetigena TaxID=1578925 RepID=UPI001150D339|nr:uncharacterized protein PpBr36_11128 [Pyricularia pennisetigena]TLS20515.1 hypothetical protein PpBr36_11128 [Pyricularia pennisetigena]